MQTRHTIIIVGGGVIGLTCAVALSEAGQPILLVEQSSHLEQSASGVPTALLVPANGKRAERPAGQLGHAGAALHPVWAATLKEQTGLDPGYYPVDVLQLYDKPPRRHHSENIWLPEAAALAREPTLTPETWHGAMLRPRAAHIQTAQYLNILDRRFQLLGGQRRLSQVTELLTTGARVAGVRLADGECHFADEVVLAAGLATDKLLAPLGLQLQLVGEWGQVIHLADIPLPRHLLKVGNYSLLTRPDRLLHVGGIHRTDYADAGVDNQTIHQMQQCAQRVLGKPGRVVAAWAGLRPLLAERLPLIGPVPGWTGVSLATGHGRNGYLLAPITAQVLRRYIETGSLPALAAVCEPRQRPESIAPLQKPQPVFN